MWKNSRHYSSETRAPCNPFTPLICCFFFFFLRQWLFPGIHVHVQKSWWCNCCLLYCYYPDAVAVEWPYWNVRVVFLFSKQRKAQCHHEQHFSILPAQAGSAREFLSHKKTNFISGNRSLSFSTQSRFPWAVFGLTRCFRWDPLLKPPTLSEHSAW